MGYNPYLDIMHVTTKTCTCYKISLGTLMESKVTYQCRQGKDTLYMYMTN